MRGRSMWTPWSRVDVERGPDAARSGPETNQPCRRDRALTFASLEWRTNVVTSAPLRIAEGSVQSRTPVLLRFSIELPSVGDGEVAGKGAD